MELKKHIDYWIKSSNEDYDVIQLLIGSNKYLHAMFLCHLSIEKLVKAHWVKHNNNSVPPKIHNLITLIKQTQLALTDDQLTFITILNDFQIQGRYPDYKFKVNQYLTEDYSKDLFNKYKELRKCLINKIA
jgi:HEPN domain-containing protein